MSILRPSLATAFLAVFASCDGAPPAADSSGPDHTGTTDSGGDDDTGDIDDTGGTDDTSQSDDTAQIDDTGDTGPVDVDGDGVTADLDCDDGDATVYPGADEVCGDGLINDCDGTEENAQEQCLDVATKDDAVASWQIPPSYSDHMRSAGIGDINGDGFDDLAFGWPTMDSWESSRSGPPPSGGTYSLGGVFLFLGPVSGDHARGDEDIFFGGVEDWDSIGWDLVGLGDLDRDGYDDFAVGAAEDDDAPATGTPAVYRVDGPADIASIAEATVLVEGSESLNCLGSSLLAVPDQDGDGAPDLLVGGRCAGEAHLLSGAGEAQVAGTDDIATFTGPSDESRFGHAMATGDLDGDGVLDIAIAAPEPDYIVGSDGQGFVSLFLGPPGGEHDSGSADIAIAAQATDSTSSSTQLGSGLGIGDLDGDGYDDLVAGAPKRSIGEIISGQGGAFVYLGPLTSDRGIPDADASIVGERDFQRLGGELDAGHDLDGDGQDDLLLGNGYVEINGDEGWRSGSSNPQAWLFLGPLTAGTWVASDADLTWDNYVSFFGVLARVAGDTDGDGLPEVLIGNSSDDLYLFDLTAGGY